MLQFPAVAMRPAGCDERGTAALGKANYVRDRLAPLAERVFAATTAPVDGVQINCKEHGHIVASVAGKPSYTDDVCMHVNPADGKVESIALKSYPLRYEFVQGDGRQYILDGTSGFVVDTGSGALLAEESEKLTQVGAMMRDYHAEVDFTTARRAGAKIDTAGEVVERMRQGAVFASFGGEQFKVRSLHDLQKLNQHTWQVVPFRG